MRKLNPSYYLELHKIILAHTPTDTLDDVVRAVGNAVFNTGSNYLNKMQDERALRRFVAEFENRNRDNPDTPDRMIDWLLDYHAGNAEWLNTLLNRLTEVFSKPAKSSPE